MLTNAEQTELADLILKWNATDILPEQQARLDELEQKALDENNKGDKKSK